jgi:hypothetical protein
MPQLAALLTHLTSAATGRRFLGLAGLLLLAGLVACGSKGAEDHRLSVQVSVNDSLLALSPLSNGSASIEMNSGDRLQLEDSAGITVSAELGGATLASLQSDDAHWAANLASSADTTVVLTLRSRIDPGQQATLSVLVRAQPLNVDVLVGAGIINPSPLVAGDTFLVNLKSGQTLTVKSSRDTSVVLGESSVRASNVISGARQWQGRLNAAVAAEVLITVTDLQDSSRKVTPRVSHSACGII